MRRKRAFVVMGPPSSGTRLMARLLIAGGCEGDGDHEQRWDDVAPTGDLVVFRRHQPTGRLPGWATEHGNVITALQAMGYTVVGIIISRDWHCTTESQVAAPHVADTEEGRQLNMSCWRNIFANLPEGVEYEIVSYESLVQRPQRVVECLYQRWGLDASQPVERIEDANAKYYV